MSLDEVFAPDTWLIGKSMDPQRKSVWHRDYPFIQFAAKKRPGGKTYGRREPPMWTFTARGWSMNSTTEIKIHGRMSGKMIKEVFFKSLSTDQGKECIFNYLFHGRYREINV